MNYETSLERLQYLAQFDDDALAAMCGVDGYYSQFQDEYMRATLEEVRDTFAFQRAQRDAWLAENFDQDTPEEIFTRADQLPERIYVTPAEESWNCFYTPDGEGRIWYESLELALEDVDAPVIYLDVMPDDN